MVTKTGIERDGYKNRDREKDGYKTTERDGYKIRDRDGYKKMVTKSRYLIQVK